MRNAGIKCFCPLCAFCVTTPNYAKRFSVWIRHLVVPLMWIHDTLLIKLKHAKPGNRRRESGRGGISPLEENGSVRILNLGGLRDMRMKARHKWLAYCLLHHQVIVVLIKSQFNQRGATYFLSKCGRSKNNPSKDTNGFGELDFHSTYDSVFRSCSADCLCDIRTSTRWKRMGVFD